MKNYEDFTKDELIRKVTELENKFDYLNKRLELYNNENYFRMVFECAQIGFVTLDTNYCVTDYNHHFLNYSASFHKKTIEVGDHISTFIPDEKIDVVLKALELTLKGELYETIDIHQLNNKDYYFKKLYTPLLSPKGDVEGILATVVDITSSEETRIKFTKTYNTFYTILNSLQLMIFAVDYITYDIIFANNYFTSINGEFERKNYFDFFANDELDLKKTKKRIKKTINESDAPFFREVYLEKYRRWFNVYYKRINWIEGKNPALLIYLIDVNEQHQTQLELQKLNQELEQKISERTEKLQTTLHQLEEEIERRNTVEQELLVAKEQLSLNLRKEHELLKLKSGILNNIAHEINTPLTIISSATFLIENMLRFGKYNEINQYLSQIQESINKLFQMVESAQKVSASTNVDSSTEIKTQNLITFLNDLVIEIESIDKGKHIIETAYQTNVLIYTTNYVALRQILLQLFDNALKFSKIGTIVILKVVEDDDNIYISVIDNGFGIAEEDKQNIFEMFYRSPKYIGIIPGTGAGLSIAQTNATSINATITFESTEGVGSEFIIILPKA